MGPRSALCPWIVVVKGEPAGFALSPLRLSQAALYAWPLALEPDEPGLDNGHFTGHSGASGPSSATRRGHRGLSHACEALSMAGVSQPVKAHSERASRQVSGFLNGLPGDLDASGI